VTQSKVWQKPFQRLQGGTSSMKSYVIENARIFDGSGSPYFPGSVRVEGERIATVAAGDQLLPREGAEVIDAGGRVLMPGMVDAHTHLAFRRRSSESFRASVCRRRRACSFRRATRASCSITDSRVLIPPAHSRPGSISLFVTRSMRAAFPVRACAPAPWSSFRHQWPVFFTPTQAPAIQDRTVSAAT
jgi:Amidohydrolase family